MAKLTTWDYMIRHWYTDFQRVRTDTLAAKEDPTETVLVPNLDDLFMHLFGKTEMDFCRDLFTLVTVTDTSLDVNYFLPSG